MENNLKSILYMTVNTVNNKIYVGIHITNKPYEFDNYYGCGISGTGSYWFKHPKYPFQHACKKYGLKAFRRYTLFVFDNYDDARKMEAQIVNEDFLKRPDVYNVALGGGSGLIPSTEIEIHEYDLDGNYKNSYRSYSYAARTLNLTPMSLHYAVLHGTPHANSYWSETKVAKLIVNYTPQAKPVYAYDLQGNFVKEYESISNYAKKHDVNLTSVQRAIKRSTKCADHYVSLEKLDKFIIPTKKRIRNKKYYQYDLDGNFIREFENVNEIKKVYNNPCTRFQNTVRNNEIFLGYQWSVEKVDSMPKKVLVVKKKIAQYDLEGNLIKIWDSFRECQKEYSLLLSVLKGLRKHTKGYTFKYLES